VWRPAAEPTAERSASETTDESAGEGPKEQPKAEEEPKEKTKEPQAREAPEALAAAAPWRWTPMSSGLLSMFVATSAAAFAIRASAGRSARGQPLLG